jgi:hypothetical protein
MKKAKRSTEPAALEGDFEAFVSAILAVPKDVIKRREAKRLKRPSPKRKRH